MTTTTTMGPSPYTPAQLSTFTTALTEITKTLSANPESYQSPDNSISLLDLKNDLLLTYIHDLTFLLLLRLRQNKLTDAPGLDVVKALAELRVYLEKGVKPIEGRLRYQLEKVVTAAVESERAASYNPPSKSKKSKSASTSDSDSSSSEEDSDTDASSSASDSEELDSDLEAELRPKKALTQKPASGSTKDLSFRPNPSALITPASVIAAEKAAASNKDGIYRPPRIQPTSMPVLDAPVGKRKEDRLQKSHTLDEFVASELSGAPVVLPSVGTTINQHGRSHKSARDRKEEEERRNYEENNFVRLPKPTKKELQKKGTRGQAGFGGEDWGSFAGEMDRISKGVERSGGSALDRSRKRKGEYSSGGVQAGERFEKRKENLGKKRRKG